MQQNSRSFVRLFLTSLFLFLFLWEIIGSEVRENNHLTNLWTEYEKANNDSVRMIKLMKLAHYYYDFLGDENTADSVSEAAIEIALKNYNPNLLIDVYNLYLESNDLIVFNDKALDYGLKAEQLSSETVNRRLEWRSCNNLTGVYLSRYDYEKALRCSNKIQTIANSLDDDGLRVKSYIAMGKANEGMNLKVQAFRHYLDATRLSEKLENKELKLLCYATLSRFYDLNNLSSKAALYKQKQIDLIKSERPVDSNALYWCYFDIQTITYSSGSNRLNATKINDILDFAYRNNLERLRDYEFSIYRSHLIKTKNIAVLMDVYQTKYPMEFQRLRVEDELMYFRLKAYFKEENNEDDSAFYYFQKSEALVQMESNKILQSNFYSRYGQFLMRQEQTDEAIGKFQESYTLAEDASYLQYMLNAAGYLEQLYEEKEDYKLALEYAKLFNALADSIQDLTKKDKLIILEIEHEARQSKMLAEMDHRETVRRHNLQYMAMIIAIIVIFLILLLISNFKIPTWVFRALGFFSFIFLFEFIILLADNKIHHLTHGEPWKIMVIKIIIIAMLLPFHHWLEHKVVHYLLEHKLINFSAISINRLKGYFKSGDGNHTDITESEIEDS